MIALSNFERTPIKEIIFTISFSNDINVNCYDEFKNLAEIKDIFPQSEQTITSVEMLAKDDENTSLIHNSFVLKSKESQNKLIQIKKGVFGFHKVKEYEGFSNLFADLKNYWNLFLSCTDIEIDITRVSLRYINFIEKASNEEWKDLLKIQTSHPFSEYDVKPQLNQFQLIDKNTTENPITINLVTASAMDAEKEGVVLDIILNKNINNSSGDLEYLFEGMRDVKNDVFERSITEITKQKYITHGK